MKSTAGFSALPWLSRDVESSDPVDASSTTSIKLMFMRDVPPSFSASFSACCVGDARDRDPPPPRGISSWVSVAPLLRR
jgi:hypothetical protein